MGQLTLLVVLQWCIQASQERRAGMIRRGMSSVCRSLSYVWSFSMGCGIGWVSPCG